MPNQAAQELRSLDESELETRLTEAKQELFNLRFRHVTGQLDNTARLAEAKRDIARIKTVLRQREIEAAEALDAQTAAEAAEPPNETRTKPAELPNETAAAAAELPEETPNG